MYSVTYTWTCVYTVHVHVRGPSCRLNHFPSLCHDIITLCACARGKVINFCLLSFFPSFKKVTNVLSSTWTGLEALVDIKFMFQSYSVNFNCIHACFATLFNSAAYDVSQSIHPYYAVLWSLTVGRETRITFCVWLTCGKCDPFMIVDFGCSAVFFQM